MEVVVRVAAVLVGKRAAVEARAEVGRAAAATEAAATVEAVRAAGRWLGWRGRWR